MMGGGGGIPSKTIVAIIHNQFVRGLTALSFALGH